MGLDLRYCIRHGVGEINPELRSEVSAGRARRISASAQIGERPTIGNLAYVGHSVDIGNDVVLGDGVRIANMAKLDSRVWLGVKASIGANTQVGWNAVIEDRAVVGSRLRLGQDVFIGSRAVLPSNHHNFLNKDSEGELGSGVIIGHGVVLPKGFMIADEAVIPVSEAVATMGRFGSMRRMVTVYGSLGGPLYSVGCQEGIDEVVFLERVETNEQTTPKSAAAYLRAWPDITAMGHQVQSAYDANTSLVTELEQQAQEARAGI